MRKKAYTLLILIILVSAATVPLFSPGFSFMAFTDSLFAFSLFTVMIGTALHIIEKGFFDPFVNNFKRFMRHINKGRQMADEIEQKNYMNAEHEDKSRRFQLILPCLTAGGILLFLSICLSFIQ